LENYRDVTGEQVAGIFLETAHPAKFNDTIQDILGKDIEIPERLREALDKPKKCFPLANSFVDLKNYLLNS
jgi:threonine synthase